MIQNNIQSDPILQADIVVLDTLFKRIAERGRNIRLQNNTFDGDDPGKDVPSAVQGSNSLDKESNHG